MSGDFTLVLRHHWFSEVSPSTSVSAFTNGTNTLMFPCGMVLMKNQIQQIIKAIKS